MNVPPWPRRRWAAPTKCPVPSWSPHTWPLNFGTFSRTKARPLHVRPSLFLACGCYFTLCCWQLSCCQPLGAWQFLAHRGHTAPSGDKLGSKGALNFASCFFPPAPLNKAGWRKWMKHCGERYQLPKNWDQSQHHSSRGGWAWPSLWVSFLWWWRPG